MGGPTLFSIYLTGLRKVLQRHSVHCHLYADDIQIFVSFPPNQTQASQALRNLEKSIADINAWMNSNSLQLNHSKCEFMLFGSKSQLNKLDIDSISVSGNDILCQTHIAILVSFLIPKYLCLNKPPVFANQFAINCAISALSGKYLTRSATEKLVHSLISSRLDFGNGLLYNLPNSQIGQLQKLQNAAARIVSLSSKRSHITPILKTLHWLPVKERIIFKILLFVYYIVNGTAPDYNKSLLRLYQPTRTLRSSNSGLLQIPLSKKSWGEQAFAHAGPALWNSLPVHRS